MRIVMPSSSYVLQLHTIDHMLKILTYRVGYCMACRGRHLNKIIFHYQPKWLYFQLKKEIWENIAQLFYSIKKKVIWWILFHIGNLILLLHFFINYPLQKATYFSGRSLQTHIKRILITVPIRLMNLQLHLYALVPFFATN